MASLDSAAPNYRRAVERWPRARNLARSHMALTTCFGGDGHGMVEHVKAFVETVCITIAIEFAEPIPSSNPSSTELLVAALRSLGLQNARGASKLDKVLSGFNRLTDALSEMRNEHGDVAHGKDGFLDGVTADHARAFLHAGDAILSVLLNSLDGKEPDLTVTREPYDRFAHHNMRIDEAVSVQARIDEDGVRPIIVIAVGTGLREEALELRVEPSRLLYGIDRLAYVELLNAAPAARPGKLPIDDARAMATRAPQLSAASTSTPHPESVPAYVGRLAPLRAPLEEFLRAQGLPQAVSATDSRLADSLLATIDQNIGLDWEDRLVLVARLKVACRRLLVQFGIAPRIAADAAERLVAWLRTQVSDPDDTDSRTAREAEALP